MRLISVAIVYAQPDKQWTQELRVARGISAIELVEISGFYTEISDLKKISMNDLQLGIFAQKVTHDYLLEEGDRVEIYRPLTADPKEVRRELAKLKSR